MRTWWKIGVLFLPLLVLYGGCEGLSQCEIDRHCLKEQICTKRQCLPRSEHTTDGGTEELPEHSEPVLEHSFTQRCKTLNPNFPNEWNQIEITSVDKTIQMKQKILHDCGTIWDISFKKEGNLIKIMEELPREKCSCGYELIAKIKGLPSATYRVQVWLIDPKFQREAKMLKESTLSI